MSDTTYVDRVGRSVRRWWPSPDRWSDGTGWAPVGNSGSRILWFVQTYRDLSKLELTLGCVRRFHPADDLLVVSDGDANPGIEQACRRVNARFQMRQRLFTVEHGGLSAQRMLESFLETDADVLIKIDPDTDLRRRLSRVPSPTERALFGTVQQTGSGAGRLTSIQGGCIVIPRTAAQEIAGSGLLESDRLKPPSCEWAVDDDGRARAAAGLTSYDWTLGWACRELKIPSRDHPEVFSRYQPGLMDMLTVGDAAIAHPRFEWSQWRKSVFYFRGLRTALAGEAHRPSDGDVQKTRLRM